MTKINMDKYYVRSGGEYLLISETSEDNALLAFYSKLFMKNIVHDQCDQENRAIFVNKDNFKLGKLVGVSKVGFTGADFLNEIADSEDRKLYTELHKNDLFVDSVQTMNQFINLMNKAYGVNFIFERDNQENEYE